MNQIKNSMDDSKICEQRNRKEKDHKKNRLQACYKKNLDATNCSCMGLDIRTISVNKKIKTIRYSPDQSPSGTVKLMTVAVVVVVE